MKGLAWPRPLCFLFFLTLVYLFHFLFFMTFSSRLRFLWLTLAVVFLDRATKAWIESRSADRFPEPVIRNFFYLVDSRNPGIAFSFLAGLSSPALRAILIVGSLVIIPAITWLLVAPPATTALPPPGLPLL